MRVTTANGLVFDDNNPECFVSFNSGQYGNQYAFVQAVDNYGDPVRYWGLWSTDEPEQSMTDILEWGGKWPTLPKPEKAHG